MRENTAATLRRLLRVLFVRLHQVPIASMTSHSVVFQFFLWFFPNYRALHQGFYRILYRAFDRTLCRAFARPARTVRGQGAVQGAIQDVIQDGFQD